MHGRLDLDFLRDLLPRYGSVPLVSISDHQRLAVADLDLRWAATVYNGLDLATYAAVAHDADGYLAFVGRIARRRVPLAAVEIAAPDGWPLRVAAKVDPFDEEYFEQEIEPLLRPRRRLRRGARRARSRRSTPARAATLFPSDWPEPFGLVMIESLAAGTPVIALRRGSVPEVVVRRGHRLHLRRRR